MRMDSSSDEEISDSEIETHSEELYSQLKNNNLELKQGRNGGKLKIVERKRGETNLVLSDGKFRCPICPGKKKQLYGYTDLLQHASGAGEGSGSGKPKLKAGHLAIAKYLKIDLAESPPPVQKDCELAGLALPDSGEVRVSPDYNRDELFVVPWTGILVNLPSMAKGGKSQTVLRSSLTSYLQNKGFNPKKVTVLWEGTDSRRKALVKFDSDMAGFQNAMLFQKAFETTGHGKGDWSTMENVESSDVFGFVAREADFQKDDAVGRKLRGSCNLSSIARVEADKMQQQRKSKHQAEIELGKLGRQHDYEDNEQDQPGSKRIKK